MSILTQMAGIYSGSAGSTPYVPTSWTQRTSSFAGTDTIFDVHYGGGTWVAVGQNGKLATSTSPTTTWTQRTSSFGSSGINGVAYDGSTYWVAVGDNGKLATSTSPTTTWTQRTSSFGSSVINGVAYDGSTYYMAAGGGGGSGQLATSTSPTGTWTQRTTNLGAPLNWCGFDGTYYVIGGSVDGSGYAIATATDPTGTWSVRDCGAVQFDNITCAIYDGSKWLLMGYNIGTGNTFLFIASDPTSSWASYTSPFPQNAEPQGIRYDSTSGVYVAVGGDAKLYTSLNGTSWTEQTSSFSGTDIYGIYNSNSYWVATGVSGKLATSPTS
jgi:hypothetical protein